MKVKVNYNLSTWAQTFSEDVDSTDAIVFPFRREQAIKLVHSNNQKEVDPNTPTIIHTEKTWEKSLTPSNKEETLMKILMRALKQMLNSNQTHPVDPRFY